MFIENLINNASKKLKEKKFSTFRLDAELMLSSIMKVSREKLLVNDKLRLDKKIINKYNVALERRLKKEPIAYINKKKEFWSLDFYVDKNTLIPRPETELMVFAVLNSFKNKDINILDIGTGSGCILLSILTELKFSRGIGIDVSKRSIRNAKLNSKKPSSKPFFSFNFFSTSNMSTAMKSPLFLLSVGFTGIRGGGS